MINKKDDRGKTFWFCEPKLQNSARLPCCKPANVAIQFIVIRCSGEAGVWRSARSFAGDLKDLCGMTFVHKRMYSFRGESERAQHFKFWRPQICLHLPSCLIGVFNLNGGIGFWTTSRATKGVPGSVFGEHMQQQTTTRTTVP